MQGSYSTARRAYRTIQRSHSTDQRSSSTVQLSGSTVQRSYSRAQRWYTTVQRSWSTAHRSYFTVTRSYSTVHRMQTTSLSLGRAPAYSAPSRCFKRHRCGGVLFEYHCLFAAPSPGGDIGGIRLTVRIPSEPRVEDGFRTNLFTSIGLLGIPIVCMDTRSGLHHVLVFELSAVKEGGLHSHKVRRDTGPRSHAAKHSRASIRLHLVTHQSWGQAPAGKKSATHALDLPLSLFGIGRMFCHRGAGRPIARRVCPLRGGGIAS